MLETILIAGSQSASSLDTNDRTTQRCPSGTLRPVDRHFGSSKLFHHPSEFRRFAKNHTAHGPVVAFNHPSQFRLGDQSQRSGDGLLEPLPSLSERDEVVVPNRVQQGDIGQGRPAEVGLREVLVQTANGDWR